MEKTGKNKRKLRFKNKGAAIIAVIIAVVIVVAVCLGIWSIVKLAKKDDYKDTNLSLHPKFTVTVLSGSMDSTPNSLSYIKNAAISGANIIEVDLMFNSDGEPVLTDDFDSINADTTVPLMKALDVLKDYPDLSLMLDLHALTNLSRIEELAEKYNMYNRLYYSGVTIENVNYVASKSPNIQYFIDVDVKSHDVDDAEYYDFVREVARDAYAINIDFEDINDDWAKYLTADGFKVSVDNISGDDDFCDALNMRVANIMTTEPAELQNLILDWLTGAR